MPQTGQGTTDYLTQRVTQAQDSPGVVTLGSLLDAHGLAQSESVVLGTLVGTATQTDRYLGHVDGQDRSYHDVVWQAKIVSTTDESAKDLILYYASVSSNISSPSPNAPGFLDPAAATLHCDLPNNTTGFFQTEKFSPKGRHLYAWCDTSATLGSAVTLDLNLNRLQ